MLKKIKQFLCNHEDTDVEFCHGAYRMIGNTCLTRGFNVRHINMSCRTCGKELGTYRLHGKGLYGGVDNKVYDIFKVNPDPGEKLIKSHCMKEVNSWVRQGFLTSDEIIRMLVAEGKFPHGWITVTPYDTKPKSKIDPLWAAKMDKKRDERLRIKKAKVKRQEELEDKNKNEDWRDIRKK